MDQVTYDTQGLWAWLTTANHAHPNRHFFRCRIRPEHPPYNPAHGVGPLSGGRIPRLDSHLLRGGVRRVLLHLPGHPQDGDGGELLENNQCAGAQHGALRTGG